MKIHQILIFLIFFILSACEHSGLDSLMNKHKNLHDNINDFEAERHQLEQAVDLVLNSTIKRLSYEKPFITSIAREWDDHISKFNSYNQDFKEEYKLVDSLAVVYLEQLDKQTKQIKNKNLRQIEQETNDNFKEKWLELKAKADEDIAAIQQILKDCKDFRTMLGAASLRQKPGPTIKTAKRLKKKFAKTFKSLGKFVEESNKHITTDGLEKADKGDDNKPKPPKVY